jgi:sterol desaturase/sphingolipid hydroxylase (fatty acid hydroxylase superfamily)
MDLQYIIDRARTRIVDPAGEFFWPYVVSALGITILFLMIRFKKTPKEAIAYLLRREVWRNRSTALDVVLSVFYAMFLAAPSGMINFWAWQKAFYGMSSVVDGYIGTLNGFQLAPVTEALLLTLTVMFCVDFATYVSHWLLHKVSWLWPMHAVHHASEHLNIFTTHRQHPLEPLYLNAFRGAFAGIGMAIFYSIFPNDASVITIMGVGAGFFIYMFTVNLHHLHVPVAYPKWLRMFLVSPHIHHLHHSRASRHINKNYGVVFSIFDRFFGTYIDEEVELDQLQFGLDRQDDPFQHRLWKTLLLPLIMPFQSRLAKTEKFVVEIKEQTEFEQKDMP